MEVSPNLNREGNVRGSVNGVVDFSWLYTLFINGGTRGRAWVEYMKARRKGLPIQMKTKQSMEMQVVSLVILEISRQLGRILAC